MATSPLESDLLRRAVCANAGTLRARMPAPAVAAPAIMLRFRNERRLETLRVGEFDSVEVDSVEIDGWLVSDVKAVEEFFSLLMICAPELVLG